MHVSQSLRATLLAAIVAFRPAAAASDETLNIDDASLPSDTGRFIVKFSASGLARMRKRDGSGVDTSPFYAELHSSGHDASPARTIDSTLWSGVSFDLTDATNTTVSEILALPSVEKIWPAAYYTLPVAAPASIATGSSGSSLAAKSEFPTWSPHNYTNVAQVQADGYLGEGVVIGLVDSGVDYTHPALGGGFGPGFKVEGGYDLVGDAYVSGSPLVPDADPMDCLGHGTHVAGIAASGDSVIPGVAPNARLRAYKVFGCSDGTYEDNIVAAFLMAYEDGVDIISASLGSNRGFPNTAMAEVATAISNAGVFVSVAAGNSGTTGPFYSSSGGNGAGQAVTVGSVQSEDFVTFVATAQSSTGETREIVYLSSEMTRFNIDGTVSAYVPEGARNKTACEFNLPPAPSTSVYVIPRGTCMSQLQDTTLFGVANHVFYILNSTELSIASRIIYSDAQPDGAGTIRYGDGDWILSQYESGNTVTFTFDKDRAAVAVPREGFEGGRINDFSSWGPTLDGRMKPEISGPGGAILSTWPVSGGSWAVYSGTSMSTPYISGVAALFFASRGGRAALGPDASRLCRDRIIGSGKPVLHNDGSANLASVAKQGAGLVDALKVIEYDTSVHPAALSLNDTDHFVGSHQVQVTNGGRSTITYKVTHVPGQTALVKGSGGDWVSTEPTYTDKEGSIATVVLSADSITLAPGETASLTLTFAEPAGVEAIYLPVYGGQIKLTGSNDEEVAVTYMGIKGSLYACNIWELSRGVPMYLNLNGGLVAEGANYTFEDGTDVPQPYFNILWSTQEFSFDFVDRNWEPSDWVYPPVAGSNNWYGSFRLIPNPLTGSVANFPQTHYPRFESGMYAQPQNVFADGTRIPSGEYKILGRALRTYGDHRDINDWQYSTSEWFRINRDPVANATSSSAIVSATSTAASSSVVPSTVASTTTRPDVTPTSVFICPTANPTQTAISLTAYVGNSSVGHNFYRQSNFLAVDTTDSQTALEDWEWVATDRSTFRLEVPTLDGAGVAVPAFAAVHTNANSLVYLYRPSSIVGAWSYLECSMDSRNNIHCESGSKQYFYVCEASGLLRHGTSVLDGCTPIRIVGEVAAPDARCVSTSVVAPSATSTVAPSATSVVASTTVTSAQASETAVPCSGNSDQVSLTASLAGSDVEYPLYAYADFLAVDIANFTETHLNWTYTNNSRLETVNAGNTVFAGVHSNGNSLIYLYRQSRLVPPYSFLSCTESGDSGVLECTSDAKKYLYICDTTSAILRSGTEIVGGCTAVTFKMQRLCAPGPSSSVPALPSSTASSTSSYATSSAISSASTLSAGPSSTSAFASSTMSYNTTSSSVVVSSATLSTVAPSSTVSWNISASVSTSSAFSSVAPSSIGSNSSSLPVPSSSAFSSVAPSSVGSTSSLPASSSSAFSSSAPSVGSTSSLPASSSSASIAPSSVGSASSLPASSSSASSVAPSSVGSASSSLPVSSSSASIAPSSVGSASSSLPVSSASSSASSSIAPSSVGSASSLPASSSSASSVAPSSVGSASSSLPASSASSSASSIAPSSVGSSSLPASSAYASVISSSGSSVPATTPSAASSSATLTSSGVSSGVSSAFSASTSSAASGSPSSIVSTGSTAAPSPSTSATSATLTVSHSSSVSTFEVPASTSDSSVTSHASASTTPNASKTYAHSSHGDYTTSTIYATSIATVTDCPPTVTDCPAHSKSTYVTTFVVAVSTTVCPPSISTSVVDATLVETASHATEPAPVHATSLPYGSGNPFQEASSVVRITDAVTETAPIAATTRVASSKWTTSSTVAAEASSTAPALDETIVTLPKTDAISKTIITSVSISSLPSPSAAVTTTPSQGTTDQAQTTEPGSSAATQATSPVSSSPTSTVVTAGAPALIFNGQMLALLAVLLFLI